MIEKVVTRRSLEEASDPRHDLVYWLSRTPEERIAAVEFLRRQMHGDSGRIQRVARVFRREPHGELVELDLAARKAECNREPGTES